MPEFLPFRAVHYQRSGAAADVSPVCAPPYDVIDDDHRAALLAADAHNSVRLILPDTAADAADAWRAWRADGVLGTDATPSFSVYRMHFEHEGRPRTTTGVIGALGLAAPEGQILPHERTLPKAKQDRLELLRATRANFDPIWGLSLSTGLSALLAPDDEPAAVALDEQGVRHELFPLTDPDRIAAVTEAVAATPVVLADGHHRYETAGNYRRERGDADPGSGAVMALVVELAEDQLCVQAIHRLITGLGSDVDLRRTLDGPFSVRPHGAYSPEGVQALEAAMHAEGGLGLVDRDGLALLVPTGAVAAALAAEPAVLHEIDAARFGAGVGPALGAATLAYRNDAATVASLVAKGAADAAVLLRPAEVDQIRAAAFAGIRMPEKTTFFAPKPRTGMVLRDLDA